VFGLSPTGSSWPGPAGDAGAAAGPVDDRWQRLLRLPRDHYVRLDGNDYLVHPAAIGNMVGN
jgi:hypothetical protein